MRLDVSAAGAVACLVAGAVARPSATTMEARPAPQIEFESFPEYVRRDNSMIKWKLSNDPAIDVKDVYLHRINNEGRLTGVFGIAQLPDKNPEPAPQTPPNSLAPDGRLPGPINEGTSGYMRVGKRGPESGNLTFTYYIDGGRGSATLPLQSDSDFNRTKSYKLINTALCLSVGWNSTPDRDMRTWSQAFAITENSDRSGEFFIPLNETLEKATKVFGNYEGLDNDPSLLGVPSSSPSASAAATTAATSAEDSNQGSPAGLSVGAKAGIGVGAGIAGLLLIGGLVFFCLRRRRRRGGQKPYSRSAGGGFASDSGIKVMMGGKELAGVNQSNPHSLYVSDPGRPHEHDGTPADSPVAGRDPRHSAYGGDIESYHGGRAEPAHGGTDGAAAVSPSERSVGGGGVDGAAASRPTSEVRSPSRYAHLIEEGMTQDEIQRLEEEERQLDAAIENAGRRSRST